MQCEGTRIANCLLQAIACVDSLFSTTGCMSDKLMFTSNHVYKQLYHKRNIFRAFNGTRLNTSCVQPCRFHVRTDLPVPAHNAGPAPALLAQSSTKMCEVMMSISSNTRSPADRNQVRGPADKPLLDGDKLKALSRSLHFSSSKQATITTPCISTTGNQT